MSRFANEPLLQVTLGPDGRPLAFGWRGRLWRVVRTAEVWKDSGCWWEGEGEKTFFRLETEGGRLVEICFDPWAELAADQCAQSQGTRFQGIRPRGTRSQGVRLQGAADEGAGVWFLYRVYD